MMLPIALPNKTCFTQFNFDPTEIGGIVSDRLPFKLVVCMEKVFWGVEGTTATVKKLLPTVFYLSYLTKCKPDILEKFV